jgi:DNA polymerase-3 subunit gamma/tau
MTYLVLALKYRPQRFDDVVGQSHVSRTLSNALKTGRAAHAYLFTGPRGVGKTTMARILAKALNCERGPVEEPCNECRACRAVGAGNAMDVIEIDGASNRGIDDIRELREAVRYSPAMLTRKVYIIDEVHMLTTDAFNALLKTLEEPPSHAVFVLATTEALKVPQTILSRCQRFDFARLGPRTAAARLRFIVDQEQISADDDALFLMARKGDGSMRDGITLLDQVLAGGPQRLTLEVVKSALGVVGRELFFEWTAAIRDRDAGRALRSLGGAVEAGANLQELSEEFLVHLRNLLLVAVDPGLADLVEATEDEIATYCEQAAAMASGDLLRHCRLALEATSQMRRSGYPRAHLEVALAEMCALPTALELRRFLDATRRHAGSGEAVASAGPLLPTTPASAGPTSAGPTSAGPTSAGPVPPIGSASPAGPASSAGTSTSLPPTRSAGSALQVREGGAVSTRTGDAPATAGPPGREAIRSDATIMGAATTQSVDPAAVSASVAPVSVDGDPWVLMLQMLGARRAALGATLNGSAVLGEEERILRVGVPRLGAFQKGQLDKAANRQLIMELINETFGRPLGVRFEPASEGMVGSGASAASTPAADPGASGGTNVEGAATGRDAATVPVPATAGAAGSANDTATTNGAPGAHRGRGKSIADAPSASPEGIRRIVDLFGGDVIGPA